MNGLILFLFLEDMRDDKLDALCSFKAGSGNQESSVILRLGGRELLFSFHPVDGINIVVIDSLVLFLGVKGGCLFSLRPNGNEAIF